MSTDETEIRSVLAALLGRGCGDDALGPGDFVLLDSYIGTSAADKAAAWAACGRASDRLRHEGAWTRQMHALPHSGCIATPQSALDVLAAMLAGRAQKLRSAPGDGSRDRALKREATADAMEQVALSMRDVLALWGAL